jgi:Tetracyclin repressor-like, C-terminal domain
MVDIVFGEIEVPAAGGDWKAELRKRAASTRELRKRAASTREALNRHRWAIGEMEGRTTHGPNNLHIHNAVLGQRRPGVPAGRRLLHRNDRPHHVGPGRQHLRLRPPAERHVLPDPGGLRPEAQRQMVDYAEALSDYPHLVEVVGGYVAKTGCDYDREFLFGLDVILDRLEQLLNQR